MFEGYCEEVRMFRTADCQEVETEINQFLRESAEKLENFRVLQYVPLNSGVLMVAYMYKTSKG